MIHYDSHQWSTFAKLKGSVLPKACGYAILPTLAAFLLKYMRVNALGGVETIDIMDSSSAYTTFTGALTFVLCFRTSQCYSRFWSCATGVCTMRSQMYEGASSLITFSLVSKKPKEEVQNFKDKIVRLFSMLHAMALSAITNDEIREYPIIDLDSIPDKFVHILNGKSIRQKPEVIYGWINTLIMRSMESGVLSVPPPILSRVFQEMEKAMVEYNQVLQIMHIPFPFPYAQAAVIMIWLFMAFTPFAMMVWAATPATSALFTFISVSCLLGLEMISAELENPFGDDHNDLPCEVFQEEMNEALMLLTCPHADVFFTLNKQLATYEELKRGERTHGFSSRKEAMALMEENGGASSEASDTDKVVADVAITDAADTDQCAKDFVPAVADIGQVELQLAPQAVVQNGVDKTPNERERL